MSENNRKAFGDIGEWLKKNSEEFDKMCNDCDNDVVINVVIVEENGEKRLKNCTMEKKIKIKRDKMKKVKS